MKLYIKLITGSSTNFFELKKVYFALFDFLKVNQRERDQVEQKLNEAKIQVDQLNEELGRKKESYNRIQQLLIEQVKFSSKWILMKLL